ncbi:MAG: hypothetical protein K0U98_27725 [Deltaproteobacteria bacterium]|nr:hypothetical protein [Deltaproteobacteria bacterium]
MTVLLWGHQGSDERVETTRPIRVWLSQVTCFTCTNCGFYREIPAEYSRQGASCPICGAKEIEERATSRSGFFCQLRRSNESLLSAKGPFEAFHRAAQAGHLGMRQSLDGASQRRPRSSSS